MGVCSSSKKVEKSQVGGNMTQTNDDADAAPKAQSSEPKVLKVKCYLYKEGQRRAATKTRSLLGRTKRLPLSTFQLEEVDPGKVKASFLNLYVRKKKGNPGGRPDEVHFLETGPELCRVLSWRVHKSGIKRNKVILSIYSFGGDGLKLVDQYRLVAAKGSAVKFDSIVEELSQADQTFSPFTLNAKHLLSSKLDESLQALMEAQKVSYTIAFKQGLQEGRSTAPSYTTGSSTFDDGSDCVDPQPEPGPDLDSVTGRACLLPEIQNTYLEVSDEETNLIFEVRALFSKIRGEVAAIEKRTSVDLEVERWLEEDTGFNRIVLLGPQSTGKSTLLDYLVRVPCGFSRAGRGTIRPIYYHVVRKPELSGHEYRFGEHGEKVSYNVVYSQLEAKQDEKGTISKEPIHIYIQSPSAYTVQVIDIPGFVSDGTEDADKIKSIAHHFCTDPKTLMVVIRKGDWEGHGTDLLETLVQKYDPNLSRTVVVTNWVDKHPGIRKYNFDYFLGLDANGKEHFPKCPKFFVDVATDSKGEPMILPVDPKGVEPLIAEAIGRLEEGLIGVDANKDGPKILEKSGNCIGIKKFADYVRHAVVRNPREELPELLSKVVQLREIFEEYLNQLQASPFMQRDNFIQYLLKDLSNFTSAIQAFYSSDGMGGKVGLTFMEETAKVEGIRDSFGVRTSNELWDVSFRREYMPDSASSAFSSVRSWGQYVSQTTEGDPELKKVTARRLSGSKASLRLYKGMDKVLTKLPMPSVGTFSEMETIGGRFGDHTVHPSNKNLAEWCAAQISRGIFLPIFRYWLQREIIQLDNLATNHVWKWMEANRRDSASKVPHAYKLSPLWKEEVIHNFKKFLSEYYEKCDDIIQYQVEVRTRSYVGVEDEKTQLQSDSKKDAVKYCNALLTNVAREGFRQDLQNFIFMRFQRVVAPLSGGKNLVQDHMQSAAFLSGDKKDRIFQASKGKIEATHASVDEILRKLRLKEDQLKEITGAFTKV